MQVFLDHAATSPTREVAIEAYLEHAHLLNPGGQYALGRQAKAALEQAREDIGELLGAEPIEVIFCASGTEADNLAIHGLWGNATHGVVFTSPLEHPGVREPIRHLAGARVVDMPLERNNTARVDSELFRRQLVEYAVAHSAGDTVDIRFATCMMANNETGAIQPIADIARLCAQPPVVPGVGPQLVPFPLHVDAVQAVGHIPVDFHALGATTLAASAHKFGGTRGVGLLLARRSPALHPLLTGGGQERGIRPGTHDVAGAVATAAALKEACSEIDAEHQRLAGLRDQMRERITATIDDVIIHTPEDDILPGHLHISFPGAEGDSLLMLLDVAGIAASTGSACASGVNRASEVLLAMGVDEPTARGALRITLGRTSTQDDVDKLLAVLPDVVSRARLAGMA